MREREAQLIRPGVVTVRARDPDAFAAAVRPRLNSMLRTAYAILGDEAEARDALQDALTDAWRGYGSLRDAERSDAWLARILLNRCRMALRTRRRRPVSQISVSDTDGSPPGGGDRPPDFAEAIASRDAMERAFERLATDLRIVLVLHYLEDRPIREIADVLGIAEGTVKSRLHTARRSLADALTWEHR